MNFRCLLIASIVIALLAGVTSTGILRQSAWCAQPDEESAAAATSGTLRFRRVYAPADRSKDWPGINSRHIPVDPAEFEQLLKQARAAGDAAQAPAARITAAEYRARLLGDKLTAGQATLRVSLAAESAAMLLLDPSRLAIGPATWARAKQPGTDSDKATLGLGTDGKLETHVEQSGQLEFGWSLQGHRDAADVVHFNFELPSCPANRLLLDLPENMAAAVDRGVASQIEGAEEGLRRWQIVLGGHHRVRLRAVPAGTSQRSGELALVRQSVAYDFSLRGVEMIAQLELEVHDEPLHKISLAMDRELELVTVQYGDVPVPWSITSADNDNLTRLILALPEPIRESGRVLRLRALAPLVTNRAWSLPRIRPEGMFWQEGNATLLVPAPLLIRQLRPIGCWQSAADPLSGGRPGESVRFQYFSPDATVEITLSRHQETLQLVTGTAVELGGAEMRAEVMADFRISGGLRFDLTAEVADPDQWLIDSVGPVEVVDDWSIERRGRYQDLKIRLAEALSPAHPVRLRIAARQPHSPLGLELTADDLVPLRFSTFETSRPDDNSRHLVAVGAVSPYQFELSGAEQLNRIDARSLDAGELELFAELPRSLLFKNDVSAAELRISLQRRKPSYSATIRMEASVAQRRLQESYAVRCVPQSVRVDTVMVHFSQRRPAPLRWTLGAEDARPISAELLSIDQQVATGIPPGGETWRLTFHRPRSVPFEILGIRQIEMAEQTPLSLAWLPEATSQKATLVIRSLQRKAVRIENHRLQPIPTEPVPPGRTQTALATYRYDPLRDATTAAEEAVTISTTSEVDVPLGWIWHCHLESRYDRDGTGQHLAIYRLQNCATEKLRLSLPSGASIDDVREVWVDAKSVGWRRPANEGVDILAVELPPGERFPTVTVHFTTHRTSLGTVGSLEPPMPESSLDMFSQSWTVWLPPGYAAFAPDLRWQLWRGSRWSLPQRLFGPLGRAVGRRVFDPLAARSWLVGADRFIRRESVRKTEQLVQTLGALASAANNGENGLLEWGDLLDHESVESLQLNLLIDRHALARLGLTPTSPVSPGIGQNPSTLGVGVLQRAQLAALVHHDTVLLTSQAEAASYRGWLAPLKHQAIWWVLPSPLHEQLSEAAAGANRGAIVPVETWRTLPPPPKTLWAPAAVAGLRGTDLHGWTARRFEISSAAPVRLKFVHRSAIQLLASVVFLAAVGLGWWKLCDRPVLLMLLAGIFGLMSMGIADAYVPIASGAVLGMLFCLVLRLVCNRVRQRPDSPRSDSEISSTVSVYTQSVIMLASITTASLCTANGVALGQMAAEKSPPVGSPVYQVFIPIDDNERPTGGKLLVPGDFYNHLRRRAATATEQPSGWLLGAATYRGVLSRETATEGLVVEQLNASFGLHVFGHGTRVRVPLSRQRANLLPDGVLLDGQVVQPEWEPEGGSLAFDVPQQGQYRLELLLRPTMRIAEAPGGFDLAIPPLATSRLELTLPPGAPTIEVPSAVGLVRIEDDPLRLVAELGPSDRLSVRWPLESGPGISGPAVDVEELLWLKVRPGSAVVDARFKFKIVEGQVKQLQLAMDPRLRLRRVLPSETGKSPEAEINASAGQSQTVTLRWPQPISDVAVVDASFVLMGTSGIGNLRLPQLTVLEARPTRRWAAVSVDPRLEYQPPDGGRPEAVAVPDFIRSWGEVAEQPLVAFRLNSGDKTFSVATRLREPQTTVKQTLALSVDEQFTEVRFNAELATTAGYNFQYRMAVPQDLKVGEVSLLEEGVERAGRFSRERDGTVTVFLTGPVSGSQRLSLWGRLPTVLRKKTPLPLVRIQSGRLLRSTLEVFRRSAVLVSVDTAVGLTEIEPELTSADGDEFGRLVGTFQLPNGKLSRQVLEVSPNRPKVRADQVVHLRPGGEAWRAEVDFKIEVIRETNVEPHEGNGEMHGLVDEFFIDVPEPVDGPFAIRAIPSATFRVVDPPGVARRVVVRPREAIDGEYRFHLSAVLALSPGDRPTAPQIMIRNVEQLNRLFALPREAHGQPIAWETRGLRTAEFPEGFSLAPDAGPTEIYQVVSEPCQAVVAAADPEGGTAHAYLADVHLAWQADGACHGVATFDVDPGKQSEVSLQLPEQYRLVQVSVAGVPTVPEPIEPDKWRVRLGPKHLPQRIEVLFRGTLPHPARIGRRRFDAPTLGELSVEQTLWTISGPLPFDPGEPLPAEAVTAWRQDMVRLKNLAARIQSASMVASEDPEETFRWYGIWAARLVAARAAVRRELAQAGPVYHARSIRVELATIDQQQLRIAARLGTSDILRKLLAEPPLADDPAEIWQWSADPRRNAAKCAVTGAVRPLTLDYRRRQSGPGQHRWAMAVGILLVAGLTALAMQRGILTQWFARWPSAMGVIIGLVWWLWMSPSILGWAIVLVSLLAPLLSGWKSVPYRADSAIISVRSQ